jgi:hypothetical protein
MMRLGMFDPMEQQPMVTEIGIADVDNAAGDHFHRRSGGVAFRFTFYFHIVTGGQRSRTTVAKSKSLRLVKSIIREGELKTDQLW